MHSAVQLASVIGSTSFEDTERGIRFADGWAGGRVGPERVGGWASALRSRTRGDARQWCRAMIVLDGCTGGRVGSGVGAVPRVAESGRWGLWVAARSAAAHSRDLVCCVNRVEVIPS